MIFGKVKDPPVKEYLARHRDEIIKLIASEHVTHPGFENLKFEFIAASTKKYFSYSKPEDTPLCRVLQNQNYMKYLHIGLSPENQKKLRDQLQVCLAHIHAQTKEAPDRAKQAGAIIYEQDLLEQQAAPFNVIVNFIANHLVREDENPKLFNSRIHAQKCDEIENEIMLGNNDFFLFLPQLSIIRNLQESSPQELMQHLLRLKTEQERLNAIMNQIISMKSAASTMKTPKRPS